MHRTQHEKWNPMRSRCCVWWAEILVLKNYRVETWIKAQVYANHLSARHVAASTENTPTSGRQCHQSTLDKTTGFRTKMTKSMTDKSTNALAKWIAVDCWPLPVVEDQGLEAVLQIASSDPTYKLPCQKTISNKIHQLYDTEKQAKVDVFILQC